MHICFLYRDEFLKAAEWVGWSLYHTSLKIIGFVQGWNKAMTIREAIAAGLKTANDFRGECPFLVFCAGIL